MSVILSTCSTSKTSKKEGNVFLLRLQTIFFIFSIKTRYLTSFKTFSPNVYYIYLCCQQLLLGLAATFKTTLKLEEAAAGDRNLRQARASPPVHVTSSITWPFDSLAICHFPSVVHWNRASIVNRFRDIRPQHMLSKTRTHTVTNKHDVSQYLLHGGGKNYQRHRRRGQGARAP